MRRAIRVLLFLFLALAPAIGAVQLPEPVEAATTQTTGTIEVHARMCDEVPVDGDWFGACHEDLATGVYFEAINTATMATVSGTTGADGNVTFTLDPGTWQIAGPPGDFLEATFIYCSSGHDTTEVAHPVTLAAGQSVVCDYYFVPENLSGMGTIEVHARMCDAVPPDGDWFGTCHDDLATGTWFDAMNVDTSEMVSHTTGMDGNTVFNLPAGTWQISGPPGDFMEEVFIYCSYGEGTDRIDHPVTLAAGDEVVCDYYFVPEDLSGLASIELHARMCDEVPVDDDWFGACHDDPAPNVLFDAVNVDTDEVVSMFTGASGNATFEVPAGTWELSGPPGDFLEATFIYCSTGHDVNELPYPLELASGDSVVCDYYFVPEDPGPTPTVVPPTPTVAPTPTATAAPTAVPPTPAPTAVPPEPMLELPVVIVAGSCADVTNATEVVAELSDAVILAGDAEGAVEAIQAATSYTRVTIPLETMLADDHVIAVLDEDGQTVVACGAIGGVADGQGAFTIGLAPVDDSGVAGTAYLAARAGGTTGISIFVVPDGLVPQPILEPVG